MSRISNEPRRQAPLSWRERCLIVEAWLTALWVAVTLRTPWRKRLFAIQPSSAEPGLTETQVQRATRLVLAAASRHVKPMTCLERALTLQFVLARRGCRATLRFGVQRDEKANLAAHAWLEEVPGLHDPLISDFVPLEPLRERP